MDCGVVKKWQFIVENFPNKIFNRENNLNIKQITYFSQRSLLCHPIFEVGIHTFNLTFHFQFTINESG